jgi:hypothetical protein
MRFWRKSDPVDAAPQLPALRVRLQHADLDEAALEGVWVGTYYGDSGAAHYHLRAARLVVAGDMKPVRQGEILVPCSKVAFLEVLGADQNPNAVYTPPGQGA